MGLTEKSPAVVAQPRLELGRTARNGPQPKLSSSPIERRTDSSSPPLQWLGNLGRRIHRVISYTPRRCRWDPDNPPPFSLGLNLLFSLGTTTSVATLYYNHPILNLIGETFNVDEVRVSIIPTLMQGGYATGLLLLCPMGDIVKRRPFVLLLTWLTAMIWLGLCITGNFEAFAALSFIAAITTVTPQIMLPLVGDLAPPHRRAHALSIVVSGLLGGILIARILSGIVAEYTSWRNIYWIALGLQWIVLALLWLFMPDIPVTNHGLSYLHILWSMGRIFVRNPVLVQACIIGFLISSCFTNYWTTLTFLLSSPPYNYDSLIIGCFAFIGLAGMTLGPPYSKAVTDRFVTLFATFWGEVLTLVGIVVGTYIGSFTVAGPVIQAFAIDLGLQTTQVANRAAIYAIEPKARNRVNTCYMVAVFAGQIMGTSVGNTLYAEGGWTKSGGASIGCICAAIAVSFLRGPREKGWIGWSGGFTIRKETLPPSAPSPQGGEEGATIVEQRLESSSPASTGDAEKGIDTGNVEARVVGRTQSTAQTSEPLQLDDASRSSTTTTSPDTVAQADEKAEIPVSAALGQSLTSHGSVAPGHEHG